MQTIKLKTISLKYLWYNKLRLLSAMPTSMSS